VTGVAHEAHPSRRPHPLLRIAHPIAHAGPLGLGERVKSMWAWFVAGAILVLVGLIWTLQGLNVLGGSAMSGSSLWATIGPIVLLIGLVLIGIGVARRRRT